MKKNFLFLLMLIIVIVILSASPFLGKPKKLSNQDIKKDNSSLTKEETNPLQISEMRKKEYPGSDIAIEQTLTPGSNYNQYIASYKSDGLKIYGFLTVPNGDPSTSSGWPVIIFNHGYIPPEQYRTTERYVAYVDTLAQSGYIVFKPDFRGNGNSEGNPEGAYYSPAYAIDTLNAIASIKKFKDVNPNKIGMWGHSMGGNITLRDLVVSKDIKAAVIWGGVVGSYDDLMNNWQRRVTYKPSPKELSLRNRYRLNIVEKYGTPQSNPVFWNSIDPTSFVSDISAPVQLHHGLADEEVPVAFSESLDNKLKDAGKTVEFYTHPDADHNISGDSFNLAMNRTIEFFNKYLKGGEL